jgi:hypothetical protein
MGRARSASLDRLTDSWNGGPETRRGRWARGPWRACFNSGPTTDCARNHATAMRQSGVTLAPNQPGGGESAVVRRGDGDGKFGPLVSFFQDEGGATAMNTGSSTALISVVITSRSRWWERSTPPSTPSRRPRSPARRDRNRAEAQAQQLREGRNASPSTFRPKA